MLPVTAQDTVRFTVFSDCQPTSKTTFSSPVMKRFAADMANRHPAFVIGVGDYIDGSSKPARLQQMWQGFFEVIAPLQSQGTVPVALAPGNHDILGSWDNQKVFKSYFGKTYFSFNHGPFHFIILDSEEPGKAGHIAGAQLAWLKQDLASSRNAALTFVAVHRPLFPISVHKGESLDTRISERNALHELFRKEGVDCIFHGHEHHFNRRTIGGIDYITTGGGGGPLYASSKNGGFHHYLLIDAHVGGYKVTICK